MKAFKQAQQDHGQDVDADDETNEEEEETGITSEEMIVIWTLDH